MTRSASPLLSSRQIVVASDPRSWSDASTLIAEYTDATAEEIGVEVAAISNGFAILRAEVERVRETYPPPGGVLVAYTDDEPVGCVALEALDGGVFELRRLYIRPTYRRGGLGRVLMLAAAEHASSNGGTEIRLDVLYTRTAAIDLYRELGYVEAAHQVEPNLMVTLRLPLS